MYSLETPAQSPLLKSFTEIVSELVQCQSTEKAFHCIKKTGTASLLAYLSFFVFGHFWIQITPLHFLNWHVKIVHCYHLNLWKSRHLIRLPCTVDHRLERHDSRNSTDSGSFSALAVSYWPSMLATSNTLRDCRHPAWILICLNSHAAHWLWNIKKGLFI